MTQRGSGAPGIPLPQRIRVPGAPASTLPPQWKVVAAIVFLGATAVGLLAAGTQLGSQGAWADSATFIGLGLFIGLIVAVAIVPALSSRRGVLTLRRRGEGQSPGLELVGRREATRWWRVGSLILVAVGLIVIIGWVTGSPARIGLGRQLVLLVCAGASIPWLIRSFRRSPQTGSVVLNRAGLTVTTSKEGRRHVAWTELARIEPGTRRGSIWLSLRQGELLTDAFASVRSDPALVVPFVSFYRDKPSLRHELEDGRAIERAVSGEFLPRSLP